MSIHVKLKWKRGLLLTNGCWVDQLAGLTQEDQYHSDLLGTFLMKTSGSSLLWFYSGINIQHLQIVDEQRKKNFDSLNLARELGEIFSPRLNADACFFLICRNVIRKQVFPMQQEAPVLSILVVFCLWTLKGRICCCVRRFNT